MGDGRRRHRTQGPQAEDEVKWCGQGLSRVELLAACYKYQVDGTLRRLFVGVISCGREAFRQQIELLLCAKGGHHGSHHVAAPVTASHHWSVLSAIIDLNDDVECAYDYCCEVALLLIHC